MALVKNADRVKVACQAQLVNIIAPIRTEPGVPAWRQTIFYPFALTAAVAGHELLELELSTAKRDSALFKDLPMTDAVVARDPETAELRIFLLNRELAESTTMHLDLEGFGDYQLVEALYLGGDDLALTNNQQNPEQVVPQTLGAVEVKAGGLTATLPAASWTVIRLAQVG